MPRELPAQTPLDRLIDALRGPRPLFWDYSKVSCCAQEVAKRLDFSAYALGLPDPVRIAIFDGVVPGTDPRSSPDDELQRRQRAVEPEHVAIALEAWRDRREVRYPILVAEGYYDAKIEVHDDIRKSTPRVLVDALSRWDKIKACLSA